MLFMFSGYVNTPGFKFFFDLFSETCNYLEQIGLIFENSIRSLEEKVESSGISVQNIRNMMKKMNGECVEKKMKENYQLILYFPAR